MVDPTWTFEEALTNLSQRYTPGSIIGGPQRNRQIEAWGQIVGRTRALAELEEAVNRYGSVTAFCRSNQIASRTLKELRQFFEALPDDKRSLKLYPGLKFGKWQLRYRLGGGGNADVWAARAGKARAAVKILKRVRGKSLERFRAEVFILEQLTGERGVLPKLDSAVPHSGGAYGQAWLAVPIATPLPEFLTDGMPSGSVVEGIAHIAATMARLHQRRIAHRDLKPDNLYVLKNEWVIGDFGIASFPGKACLTTGNNKLGPLHFIAPEMLHSPEKSDGAKADVYSLAKTLWVLLTGERFPLPGEHRSDIELMQLRAWMQLDGSEDLDLVLEGATRFDPAKRLSMIELHASLDQWMSKHR